MGNLCILFLLIFEIVSFGDQFHIYLTDISNNEELAQFICV